MTTTTAYPSTIQQTIGGQYAAWKDLNNIKNDSNTLASCNYYGKSASPNRPAKIICTGFQFQIPVGAKITQITVEYAHQKVAWTTNNTPNIPAPTITLKNVNGASIKGTAPTTNSNRPKQRAVFNITPDNNDINNSNFGVEFDYPANTNENSGLLYLQYVRIEITYTPVEYAYTVHGTNPFYTGDTGSVTIDVTNVNKNAYNPTLEITLPQWVSFTSADGDGTITQNGNTLYWKIPFKELGMGARVTLNFLAMNTSNNERLFIREPLTNTGTVFTFNIINDPGSGYTVVGIDEDNIVVVGGENNTVEKIYLAVNTEMSLSLIYPDNNGLPVQMVHDSKAFNYKVDNGSWNNHNNGGIVVLQAESELKLKYSTLGKRIVQFKSNNGGTIYKTYEIYVTPTNPGVLSASVLTVDSETTDLMADNYVYTVQTYLKINSVVNGKEFYDCGKNCRMIIFNNEIPAGTADTISYMLSNVEYISDCPSIINDSQVISTDFVYHEEYPLYILFTSDYSNLSSNGFDLEYTSPCIVEKIMYSGYEPYGNYPYPINNVLSNSDTAEIHIPLFKQSNSFILSKPPLPEWYGTGENTAVVGIQLDFDLAYSDECVVYAKLHNPDGRIGTRSIVLKPSNIGNNEESITIGGLNDLFGFDVLDIKDFNKWELEIQYNNIFTNEDQQATISFNNARLTIHTATIEEQAVYAYVDGKDLRYYGLYLKDVIIPEGLETDTKYLNIDGTDANEAYRQNIAKKTITLEFDVDGCDIHETTETLRRITKIFTNKRDSLNRPIPKQISFSHYPDIYWDFITTDAIDTDIQFSNYTAKIKLIVPSGTANSVNASVTNNIGANNSLAKVNPVIQIVPTGSEITITEKNTNQSFTIINTSLASNDIIQIDCINRKVTVKKGGSNLNIQDITSSVSYSADWFIIHGEFYFETINCMIQTVSFTERW